MTIKLYDTAARAKVDFEPLVPGKVTMYVCGPTVYDDIHIGNARTFLSFDVIRRWLAERGYEVTFAQNLTDVDDKIIRRANEEGTTASAVAERCSAAFIEVMHRFGIADPDIRPRATAEIDAMLQMIGLLVEKGHAYPAGGDVYFSVRSDTGYGRVSGRNVDELLVGARIEAGEAKRDPLDFALWKAAKPGEPTWDSPWGPGRPGWHSECAAMVHRYLGMPVDIHGGGSDLAFPHHENEAAQACCAWGGDFANHWMHTGMLLVDGEKMSKSLGNFFTLREVLDSYEPDALRLLMLQTHYRSPLDFSYERLQGAQGSLERIRNTLHNLAWAADHAAGAADAAQAGELAAAAVRMREEFAACMDDDFNTAGALASVFALVTAANAYLDAAGAHVDPAACAAASDALAWGLAALGIAPAAASAADGLPVELIEVARTQGCYDGDDPAAAAEALLSLRAEARAARNWAVADAVRDALGSLGLAVEDTPQGARVRRA
jgi:cysteinyl-tRNA synthetase